MEGWKVEKGERVTQAILQGQGQSEECEFSAGRGGERRGRERKQESIQKLKIFIHSFIHPSIHPSIILFTFSQIKINHLLHA